MIADRASPTTRPQGGRRGAGPARRRILGARIDDADFGQVLAAVDAFVRSGTPHHVMTPNPEYVMIARRCAAFRTVLDEADLAPADGVGVRWAGKLLGESIREVVPGSELVERMAVGAAQRGDRWFLLGGEPGVAAAVGRILAERHAGLAIAGSHGGAPDPAHDDELCGQLEAAAPVDVLLVAFGAPAQDLWIDRNQQRLRIPVAMGVGGTFNFIAGRSRRPPRLVKRLNLIWLFRLATEPWRWRRQLSLVRFAVLVALAASARALRGARRRDGGRTTS